MKTKVDENTTPETIIAEAMVGAGAPLMHSRVEEAVAGALRKAGMLVERSEQVCAWCPSSARGSAWHNDGKLHPSCGQIDHGQGWVPEYPVDVLMSVRVERDAALARIAEIEQSLRIEALAREVNGTLLHEYERRFAESAKLHQPFEWSFGYGPVKSCSGCADRGVPQEKAEWPCPTAIALGLNEGENDE